MFNRINKIILILFKKIATHKNYIFVLKNFKPLLELKYVNSLLESKRFFQLIETIELDVPRGRHIVVIAPHTDDDIFGAGGTLLKAASKGAKISIIYLSNSAKTPSQVKLVKKEAESICNNYGAYPYFLDLAPGHITINDKKIISRLSVLLKNLAPSTLFISFFLDDNDDHRRANQLFIKAVNHIDLSKVEIWAYQIYSTLVGNVIIDITDKINAKKSLMKMWKNVEGNRNWIHYILGMNMMNCRYLSKKGKRYGELFFVVPAEEYIELCEEYFLIASTDIYHNPNYHLPFKK
jgi:LmbE family N-acetylglucosaminyl deacetylase